MSKVKKADKANTVPEYLKELTTDLQTDSLERLSYLVNELDQAEIEIAECEEALSAAKERRNKIAGAPQFEGEIPTLLLQLGISDVRLKDGRKVEVKPGISVSVANEVGFHKFLADRKEDDIIKLHFDFARMPNGQQKRLFEFLMKGDYEYDSKKDIHYQTLAKYVREFLVNDSTKEEMLTPYLNIYKYNTTKVK